MCTRGGQPAPNTDAVKEGWGQHAPRVRLGLRWQDSRQIYPSPLFFKFFHFVVGFSNNNNNDNKSNR